MTRGEPVREAHLTEDELDDILIGVGSPEAEAHVAGCAACAGRKAEFVAALTSFNQATMAWSEAKSHTLTRDLAAATESAAGSPRLWVAAMGLCVVAVMGAMLSNHVPGTMRGGDGPAGASAQTAPVNRDLEIADDDAMLKEIDAALYRPEPSPEQVYGQVYGQSQAARRRAATPEVRE